MKLSTTAMSYLYLFSTTVVATPLHLRRVGATRNILPAAANADVHRYVERTESIFMDENAFDESTYTERAEGVFKNGQSIEESALVQG